jgi:hypothetical protein
MAPSQHLDSDALHAVLGERTARTAHRYVGLIAGAVAGRRPRQSRPAASR